MTTNFEKPGNVAKLSGRSSKFLSKHDLFVHSIFDCCHKREPLNLKWLLILYSYNFYLCPLHDDG